MWEITSPRKPLAALLFSLVLGGCAAFGPPPTPEERVAERTRAWLDALLAFDIDEAYSFYSPATREVYTKVELASAYAGARRWTSAEVDKVVCEGERCEVSFYIEYELVRPRFSNRRPLSDVWVFTNGNWYLTKP